MRVYTQPHTPYLLRQNDETVCKKNYEGYACKGNYDYTIKNPIIKVQNHYYKVMIAKLRLQNNKIVDIQLQNEQPQNKIKKHYKAQTQN